MNKLKKGAWVQHAYPKYSDISDLVKMKAKRLSNQGLRSKTRDLVESSSFSEPMSIDKSHQNPWVSIELNHNLSQKSNAKSKSFNQFTEIPGP
jgi:hypothetical protein